MRMENNVRAIPPNTHHATLDESSLRYSKSAMIATKTVTVRMSSGQKLAKLLRCSYKTLRCLRRVHQWTRLIRLGHLMWQQPNPGMDGDTHPELK